MNAHLTVNSMATKSHRMWCETQSIQPNQKIFQYSEDISVFVTMGSTIDVTSKSPIIPTQCTTHFSHHLITIRSDKTSHVLTDTSLKFVISFRSYLRICDYGVSNRCDSKESYAPNSMYDYTQSPSHYYA
jgi:hypothetical protein